MNPHPDRHQAGLALLEVLMALAIASLSLIALYQGTAAGLIGTGTAAHIQDALSHARSHIAALDAGGPMPTALEGDEGRFHYRVTVRPESTLLRDVQVTISWQEGRQSRAISLYTKRAVLP